MTETLLNPDQEYNRSLRFFLDGQSYVPFSLTPDGERLGFCIDPRPQEGMGDGVIMAVPIQSPGGDVGEIRDARLVAFANGYRITDEQAARREVRWRRARVLGTHGLRDSCRYQDSERAIMDQIAVPNGLTTENLARMALRMEHLGDLRKPIGEIATAAAHQRDEMDEMKLKGVQNRVSLPRLLDSLYPTLDNVPAVVGPNHAAFYITNYHPHLGLDRNAAHCPVTGQPLVVSAYHDSVGASVADLVNFVSVEELPYRIAARIARTAATQTILTEAHGGEMTFLDVYPAHNGLTVRQEQRLVA